AHCRKLAFRRPEYALLRYVPPVLSLLRGLPQSSPIRGQSALQLECGYGHGLSGAYLLLSGLAFESAFRSGAGKLASAPVLPVFAFATGPGRHVLCYLPEKALPQG